MSDGIWSLMLDPISGIDQHSTRLQLPGSLMDQGLFLSSYIPKKQVACLLNH